MTQARRHGRAPGNRWAREWTAIGVGLGVGLAAVALFVLAGVRTVPEELVGPAPEPGPAVVVGAFGLPLVLPFALAAISGRPRWMLGGLVGLVAAVGVTALLAAPLIALADSAAVLATLALGVVGAAAIRHERRSELALRAVVVGGLVAVSVLLARLGAVDPGPVLALPAVGVADALGAALARNRPSSARRSPR